MGYRHSMLNEYGCGNGHVYRAQILEDDRCPTCQGRPHWLEHVVFPSSRQKSPWEPIETAPKDGSRIMVWIPDTLSQYGNVVTAAHAAFACWYPKESFWVAEDPLIASVQTPTHWMPLPPPPEQR